tara:strand:+ start:14728 stop:15300 length:573 start_codon:yes stop_codon:yes gene_type:complete
MELSNLILTVKNMVCDRCIKVVKEVLTNNNIEFARIELGKIYLNATLNAHDKATLKVNLEKEGFEIAEEFEAKIVNEIKILVIEHVHYGKPKLLHQKFSTFLASSLGIDYSQMSRVFSEMEGNTIEHYIIQQKIERAKELLLYNELTLSQISYELNYSSPQHLSRQFKKITGLTPTLFKNSGLRNKLDTI